MLSILSTIIGFVARGKSAKAIGAAIPGVIGGALFGPEAIEAFQSGVGVGVVPAASTLGHVVGAGIGGLVNFAFAWVAPKNKE